MTIYDKKLRQTLLQQLFFFILIWWNVRGDVEHIKATIEMKDFSKTFKSYC